MIPKKPRISDKQLMAMIREIGRCEYCGQAGMVHCHHIKSRGAGGGDTADNCIALCPVCHTKAHWANISRKRLIEIVERRNETWRLFNS